jgi:alpha-beta hydrolase superfamily lysophospholipase
MRLSAGREPVEEWSPWRGADIHLDRYAVPEAPLTVILLHGVGGYGRLLAPLGLMLQEHGYEAVLPDLPGYGLSVVSPDQVALDRWVDCVADLAEVEAQRSGRRVVLFGMSLGWMLGYMAAVKGSRAACVIATTLLDLRLPMAREQGANTPRLAPMLTRMLPPFAAVFGGLRLPIRWFTNMGKIANDPKLARLVCEDSVGGGSKVPLRFLRSLLAFRPAIEPEGIDLCPLLLAHPATDC